MHPSPTSSRSGWARRPWRWWASRCWPGSMPATRTGSRSGPRSRASFDAASRPRAWSATLRARRAPSETAPGFVSLMGGLGEMVEALVAGLPDGALMPGTPVRALRRRGTASVAETAGGPVLARVVVLALPPPRAAPLVAGLSGDAAKILAGIPFRLDGHGAPRLPPGRRGPPLDGYGVLVPRGEGLRTTAITFSSTKLPGRAPDGHGPATRSWAGSAIRACSASRCAATGDRGRGPARAPGHQGRARPEARLPLAGGHPADGGWTPGAGGRDRHPPGPRTRPVPDGRPGCAEPAIPDVIADATRAASEAALVARR
jgi:hypothetical protein